MPSGAKKRKAAKRKEQEQEKKQQQQQGPYPSGFPASPTTGLLHPPQGNGEREEADDDLVSQDGKGSESGGNFASSPARENHHYHHIGIEEEEQQTRAKVEAEGEEKKGKKESDCAVMVDKVNVMEGAVNGGSKQPSQSLPPQKTEDEVTKKTEEEVPVVVAEVKNVGVPPPPPSYPVPATTPTEVPICSLEAVTVEHVQSEKGEDGAVSGDVPQSNECKESDAVETADPVIPLTEEVVQTSDVPVESVNLIKSAVEVPSEKNEETVVPLSQASCEQPDLSLKSQPDTENCETVGTTEVVRSTQLEQRTSWMSCCGLFDSITGAGR